MSEQPITYESVLKLIHEGTVAFRQELNADSTAFRQKLEEERRARQEGAAKFDREMAESRAEFDRRMKKTDKKIGDLTGSIGKVIEHMVAGHNIVKRFQALGYNIERCSRNITFGHDLPDGNQGEIDLFF